MLLGRLGTPSPIALQKGLEKSNTFVCFRYVFVGANHQAGFSPWRAIGWFNTMTTGKRQQAANLRKESFELWPLMTAASPDQRAIYDWAWSGNSQASSWAHSPPYSQTNVLLTLISALLSSPLLLGILCLEQRQQQPLQWASCTCECGKKKMREHRSSIGL